MALYYKVFVEYHVLAVIGQRAAEDRRTESKTANGRS